MTNTRTRILMLLAAGGIPALVWAVPGSALPGDPTNPLTAPIPAYDYDDAAKSFLVELQFGATSASLVDATVGTQRSRSHLGDPPLLILRSLGPDGTERSRVNSWDPRWVFDEGTGQGESKTVVEGRDTLTLPFDADAATLVVHDNQTSTDLAEVDLQPAIHDFCAANPSDPDCLVADLAVTGLTATGDPLGVVGTAVPVQVSATVENLGPDSPIDGRVTTTATGSPGLRVAPASDTQPVAGLAVGEPRTVTQGFEVTCTQSGAQALSVTTAIAPTAARIVDPVPTNNDRTVRYAVDCPSR